MNPTLHRFPLKPLVIALAAAQCLAITQAMADPTEETISQSSSQDEYIVASDFLTIAPNVTLSSTASQQSNTLATVRNFKNTTLINNQGIISNQYKLGFYNGAGSLAEMINSGVISSSESIAFENDNSIGTLKNSGTIMSGNTTSGADYMAALTNFGDIDTVINTESGVISGAQRAIYTVGVINTLNNDGYIGNQGSLNGINGIAIQINGNGKIGTLNNSGTIAGDIINNSSNAMLINGGANRRGTLTGQNNNFLFSPINSDVVGLIKSTNADVRFGQGMLLLNDDVNLGGIHTLTNSADVQINQPLKINGNYHQTSDAILRVGVTNSLFATGSSNDFGYGRLRVSGNALLDPGSSIKLSSTGNSFGFAAGQRYLVITADTATYNEDTLKYSVSGYQGAVKAKVINTEEGRNLAFYLEENPTNTDNGSSPPTTPSTPTSPVISPAPVKANPLPTTGNAISSLSGLSGYSGFSNGLLNLFNASKTITTQAEANRIGEQLAPTQNTMASTATAAASMDALGVVGGRMDSVRVAQIGGNSGSGIATGDDSLDWSVWGQPFYGSARQGMIDNVSGYRAHYAGLVLGADHQVLENWRAGVGLSYSRTSVKGEDNVKGSSSDVDAWGGILYASYTGDPWFVNLSTSLTRQVYDSQRNVGFSGFSDTASGHFRGQQVAVKGEAGYPLMLTEKTVLTPLASLSYSYLHQGSYQENSESGSALSIDSTHSQSVESGLGAKLSHSWSVGAGELTPFVQAMWTHQYDRSRMTTTSAFAADAVGETRFTTQGASPASDSAEIGVGATLAHSEDLSLEARYDLQAAPHYEGQTVSLQVRKLF